MKIKPVYIILGAVALLVLIPGAASAAITALTFNDIIPAADNIIQGFEGFSATPYWDVSRYSWGYGTAAPGPTGTITRDQAQSDMNAVVQSIYNTLSAQITRSLTVNQWAALLSFAYNEGTGNAESLIVNINAFDDTVLGNQWAMYIYSGGAVNQTLVNRRSAEWQLWNS